MPRPRRKPAPPGRVEIICTGRGEPDHDRKHLEALQAIRENGRLRFKWMPRGQLGRVPVTGHRRSEEGLHTIDARCGTCRRHLKRREEDFAEIVQGLAEQQGTHGERPVIVDISVIEQALLWPRLLGSGGHLTPGVATQSPPEGV